MQVLANTQEALDVVYSGSHGFDGDTRWTDWGAMSTRSRGTQFFTNVVGGSFWVTHKVSHHDMRVIAEELGRTARW